MTIEAQPLSQIVRRIGVVKSYARKSDIFREGDPANHVCEVISGTVCTCKMFREGRRQIAGFYFAGDVFGLEAAGKHVLAAQAITDAKVRLVKKQELSALASSDGEVSNRLLLLTTRELARQQDLILLLSRSAQDRVVYFLIGMAERGSTEGERIALPMSRMDIADYLGLTLETVSRAFWDLERRGGIEISERHNVVLRNHSVNRLAETSRLIDVFERIKGRRPITEKELDDWLGSMEGKAATLFDLTSLSRWGERARS
jgi:CRP/FNR family transcriptional regulator, nitrogen fixation regulation protein